MATTKKISGKKPVKDKKQAGKQGASSSKKSPPSAHGAKKAAAPKAKPSQSTKTQKPTKRTAPLLMPRPSLLASFSGNAPVLPARLQTVVDRAEIADVLYLVARGIDRMDETILRSVFHPDATLDMGPGVFQGTSQDYIHWVLGAMSAARSSHHLIGNIHARVEGDAALVESYCQTYIRLDKPTGREDLFLGSRYLDRFERRPAGPNGVWKIMHRKEVFDWARTEMASDLFYHQNPDALWSYRTKTDLSTQMNAFPGSQQGSKMPAFLGRRYDSKSLKL